MPLIKSHSKAAFGTNVAEMIKAGHPRNQALAAAYATQRRYAPGGPVDYNPNGNPFSAPAAAMPSVDNSNAAAAMPSVPQTPAAYNGGINGPGSLPAAPSSAPPTSPAAPQPGQWPGWGGQGGWGGWGGLGRPMQNPSAMAAMAQGPNGAPGGPSGGSGGFGSMGGQQSPYGGLGALLGMLRGYSGGSAMGGAGGGYGGLGSLASLFGGGGWQAPSGWQGLQNPVETPQPQPQPQPSGYASSPPSGGVLQPSGYVSNPPTLISPTLQPSGYGSSGFVSTGGRLATGGVPRPFAAGGIPRPHIPRIGGSIMPPGLIKSHVPGRTDRIPAKVPSGSYVIPADIVAHKGQGNTLAGAAKISSMFKIGMPKGHSSIPRPPALHKYADGGNVGQPVDIVTAGGEMLMHPEDVQYASLANNGDGSLRDGHNLLDAWVKQERKNSIAALKKLPGPKK